MKPSELFGVIIRTIGLLLMMLAVSLLLLALLNLVGGGPGDVAGMVLIGVPCLIVGRWFLRGAPFLVSFAYKNERQEQGGQTGLERDAQEALMLLKAGKSDEAKVIVDKILDA